MNFLVDIIPPKARRIVYGVLSLLGIVYTTWQASDGNWRTALASFIAAAVTALAHANTNEPVEDQPE